MEAWHDDAKTGDDYRAYFRELRTISRRASGLSRAQPRYWWDAAMMTTFDAYRATRQRLNRRAVSRPRPT